MSETYLQQMGITPPSNCEHCEYMTRGVCTLNPMEFTLTGECPASKRDTRLDSLLNVRL